MAKVTNLSAEATVERNVLKYLNNLPGTKAVKWSQEGRQKGNPDIICSHFGMMVLIEMKKEGEKQELLQVVTMEEWAKTGAITLVATRLEHVKELMELLIQERSNAIMELEEKLDENN